MTQVEMKQSTQKFALRIIKLVESLPNTKTAIVIGNQLLRSGTSVGANYRAACRAKSTADFISKLSIVEEENLLQNLMKEADEILSIVVSSIKTTKEKRNPKSEILNPKSADSKSL